MIVEKRTLRVLRCLVLAAAVLGSASLVTATPIDLGHPTFAPILTTGIGNPGEDRSVVFDVNQAFFITSAGIRFDPLEGGAIRLAVDIYQSGLSADTNGPHGPLLATAEVAITDVGLAFYDVPIQFAFLAGQRYDVAFRSVEPDGWGLQTPLNQMELYFFDYKLHEPFTVGPVTVVDGASHPNNYGNLGLPHLRLDAVPEPASLLLLAGGLAGLVLRRRG